MNRFLAVLIVALYSWLPAKAGEMPSPSSEVPVKEQGARHGQAIAAAKICPGARRTTKAESLGDQLDAEDRADFDRESAIVVAAWDKAFACTDVDPAQTREINGCRKAKILSCSSAWQEIGPEGMAVPGLLEFKPGSAGDAP